MQGADFNKTYALVIRFTSAQAVLEVAARLNLELYKMDVLTSFLNEDFDENSYMEAPRRVVCNNKENQLCTFNKALYTLKQAFGQ